MYESECVTVARFLSCVSRDVWVALPICVFQVRHRWCELVVKHKYAQAYGDVEHFLIHDQAMGVYLYGELMIQEDSRQQALARRCLSLVQNEMDQSARRMVL
ncbi:unnamed protein product [Oncorhynchus mykiss]|uniref:Peptidase M1 leukotriene A4 hydrolase/aminopeptidase C-terminal domain-containing protein n=1 Tax=Oncorhynchus mykiss TaxID=8022 RepID=A0A060Y2X3_ONCMY|nr:unnamed protein product [Oncorhynchus mykiss]